MNGGRLYEGTGLFGRSRLIEQKLENGAILKEKALDSRYFGEGITVLGDEIFQLTYLSNVGFVYDKNSLTRLTVPDSEGKELLALFLNFKGQIVERE